MVPIWKSGLDLPIYLTCEQFRCVLCLGRSRELWNRPDPCSWYPVQSPWAAWTRHGWINMLMTPALLCHKDTAQGTQSPLLEGISCPSLCLKCRSSTNENTAWIVDIYTSLDTMAVLPTLQATSRAVQYRGQAMPRPPEVLLILILGWYNGSCRKKLRLSLSAFPPSLPFLLCFMQL